MAKPDILNAEGEHVPPVPTVAELLAQSRQAHLQYRAAAGTVDRTGKILKPYDGAKATPAVEEALAKRLHAHDLDPEHADPAWGNDGAIEHAVLVRFYQSWLQRP